MDFCQLRNLPTLLKGHPLLFYYLTFKEDKTTEKPTFALHGHGSAAYDPTILPACYCEPGSTRLLDHSHSAQIAYIEDDSMTTTDYSTTVVRLRRISGSAEIFAAAEIHRKNAAAVNAAEFLNPCPGNGFFATFTGNGGGAGKNTPQAYLEF